jgi:dihydrofolate reductase
MTKKLSIVVVVDQNRGIGLKNKLLTYISADLKRFKEITKGHTVVMGKNTWLSLPKRPLPKRTNIVITSNKNIIYDGAVVVNSIVEAIEKCDSDKENFIIGGALIYRQFLPVADKIYLTQIHKKFSADAFFPDIDKNEWKEVNRIDISNDKQAGVEYSFIDLERIK